MQRPGQMASLGQRSPKTQAIGALPEPDGIALTMRRLRHTLSEQDTFLPVALQLNYNALAKNFNFSYHGNKLRNEKALLKQNVKHGIN